MATDAGEPPGLPENKEAAAPGSKAFRRQVQMVFQDPCASLHPRQGVDRLLAEPLAIHGIGHADEREARISVRSTSWAWARALASGIRISALAASASAVA